MMEQGQHEKGGGSWGSVSVKKDQIALPAVNTTSMIRGLPPELAEMQFFNLLDERVGPGTYDFAYLPWADRKRSVNMGYAFVNIVPERLRPVGSHV